MRFTIISQSYYLIVLLLAFSSAHAEQPIYTYIMDVSDGKKLISQCSRDGPRNVKGYWELNNETVVDLEKKLKIALDKSKGPDIDKYIRQYVGILVEDDSFFKQIFSFLKKSHSDGEEKRVYANMVLYDASLIDSATSPIIVCDGGFSSWGIEYDLESEKFMNFLVNGPY